MLKLFLKRGKGSISVFVTVIMVPVVFFIGFLVDLSRIKFCGNQAAMAADNYGEAILTDYDNLLKELYGLFALTQNQAGTEALDRLDEYVRESNYYKTPFCPNESIISFGHIKELTATRPYEGWMPYQNANVNFEVSPVEGATLDDPRVFNTQIGDFMKFRIVQTIGDDEEGILKAIASVQEMDNNIEAVKKRDEITDKAAEALEAAQDYYALLESLWQYPDYIEKINTVYQEETQAIESVLDSKYSYYKAYADEDPQAIEDALEHRQEIQEAEEEKAALEAEGKKEEAAKITVEELSAEEERLCQIDDNYQEYLGHSPQELKDAFAEAVERVTERKEWEKPLTTEYGGGNTVLDHDGDDSVTVNFHNFDQKVQALQDAADKVEKKLESVEKLRAELEATLQGGNITPELKAGIEEEMEELDKLFQDGSAANYRELADHIAAYSGLNSSYRQQTEEMIASIQARGSECIESHPDQSALPDYEDSLDYSQLGAYGAHFSFLRDALYESFGNNDANSTKKEAEKKQDEAQGLLDDIGDALKEDEEGDFKRDIPSGADFAGMGDSESVGGFHIADMLGDAADSFKSSSLEDLPNMLLTKLYLVQYDFGMFTSRVTNVEDAEGGEQGAQEESVQLSLTGYPMAPNYNYLYQSEIEYLLGGHNSSQANLNHTRNTILGFRAVMNFVSTYTVKPVDSAIKAVSSAAAAVPVVGPVLKIVVAGALRLAVAGVETYGDWVMLTKGEAVCVLKQDINDLSVMALPGFSDKLKGLLKNDKVDVDFSKKGDGGGEFKLDYEQYCFIMLLFLTRSEVLSQRSADLITLNVNTVKKKIGSGGVLNSLEFRMEDTVTAVDVTCAVQLDMVVMPKGFARSTLDSSTYAAVEEFEQNTYKFTVTRGY